MAKMDWLIDRINKKECEFQIAKKNQNFGTICMPTGYGKSSVIFEDIVYRIFNWKKGDKPLIVNLSSPILKLTQQTVNDLLQTLAQISGLDKTLFHFYICSSDCGDSYDELKNIDTNSENFEKQSADSFKEICLVATCHKSLWKFIDKFAHFENAKDTYQIVSYLDEAHKIEILPDVVNRSREDRVLFQYKRTLTTGEYEKLSDEEKSFYTEVTSRQLLNRNKQYILIQAKSENTIIDLNLLESFSTSVYAVTATPNSETTDELYATQNGRNRVWGEMCRKKNHKKVYTIFKSASDAIQENIICPPLVKIVQSKKDNITTTLLEDLMQDAIQSNPNIKHKVLVTLRSCEEVKNIRSELEALGNKVFSTDSKNGFGEEESINSIQGFIKEVEEYEGNCFVLHIRQLIEGIDISGLTDCVIFTNAENHDLNKQDYKRYVQTIGRTLRLGKERDHKKDERLKKSSNVYFVTKDNRSIIDQFRTFVNSYYGYGNVHFFESDFHETHDGGDDGEEKMYTGTNYEPGEGPESGLTEIEKLWMSTKEELDKIKEMILKLPSKAYVYEQIYGLCMAHQADINGTFDTEDYLYNKDIKNFLFDKVAGYLEDINGNPKGWRELCEKRSKIDD